jgi:hypothetical protein
LGGGPPCQDFSTKASRSFACRDRTTRWNRESAPLEATTLQTLIPEPQNAEKPGDPESWSPSHFPLESALERPRHRGTQVVLSARRPEPSYRSCTTLTSQSTEARGSRGPSLVLRSGRVSAQDPVLYSGREWWVTLFWPREASSVAAGGASCISCDAQYATQCGFVIGRICAFQHCCAVSCALFQFLALRRAFLRGFGVPSAAA